DMVGGAAETASAQIAKRKDEQMPCCTGRFLPFWLRITRMGSRTEQRMAGGGIKGGLTYGATDDFSYNVVENAVSVHDLHATMLHLLGVDHKRFTHKFQGLDARLTGVEKARVVGSILS